MYFGENVSLTIIEDNFLELNFNNSLGSVNKLDKQTLGELDKAIRAAQQAKDANGLSLTSSQHALIVGAESTPFQQIPD